MNGIFFFFLLFGLAIHKVFNFSSLRISICVMKSIYRMEIYTFIYTYMYHIYIYIYIYIYMIYTHVKAGIVF